MTLGMGNNIRPLRCASDLPLSYLLLIVEPAGQRATVTESVGRERFERMFRFSEDLKKRGLLTVSQSLTKIDHTAARVRQGGQEAMVVDGPFAETKEMIGGFFLLTCESRDEAIAIAKQCPATEWATVEVRQLGPCFH
jgi:hypothetical protein